VIFKEVGNGKTVLWMEMGYERRPYIQNLNTFKMSWDMQEPAINHITSNSFKELFYPGILIYFKSWKDIKKAPIIPLKCTRFKHKDGFGDGFKECWS